MVDPVAVPRAPRTPVGWSLLTGSGPSALPGARVSTGKTAVHTGGTAAAAKPKLSLLVGGT